MYVFHTGQSGNLPEPLFLLFVALLEFFIFAMNALLFIKYFILFIIILLILLLRKKDGRRF